MQFVRGVLASAAAVASAITMSVGAAAVTPPPNPVSVNRVTATDASGRYVLARTDTTSPFPALMPQEIRIDRLTGATQSFNRIVTASGDLASGIVVSDRFGALAWTDLTTGASVPVPPVAPAGLFVRPVQLSGDGQLLLTGFGTSPQDEGGFVSPTLLGAAVVAKNGAVDVAPLADALPIDMSPNGRWVLLQTIVGAGSGAPVTYHRWDRATGTTGIYATTSNARRSAFWIGDQGEVIEREFVTGDGVNGGSARLVARHPGGRVVELVAAPATGLFEASADGTLLATYDGGGSVAVIDTFTGERTVSTLVLSGPNASLAVGSSGRALVGLSAGPGLAPTTADTIFGLVPGRSAVPRIAVGETLVVPVAGVRGVPADASAVVLNVTVTNPAAAGFVTVWPCDQVRPDASNVNFTSSGATVANAVIAKVAVSGPFAGSVCFSSIAATDLIVDVQGYFTGAGYSGVTPDRFADTRNGEVDAVGNVGAGGVVTVPVRGVRGVAADASAVVLNVTVTNTAGPGFVTVWPCDQVRPDASNVNFTSSGVTVANAVVAKVAESGSSAGAVCLSPSTGADLIVDVQGAFTGSTYTGVTPDRFFDSRG